MPAIIAGALTPIAPDVLEYNTIADNRAVADSSHAPRDHIPDESGRGGAMLVYSGGVFRNAIVATHNIVWGNRQALGAAIAGDTAAVTLTRSDVEGRWPGAGNRSVDPEFADTLWYALRAGSPAAAVMRNAPPRADR